MCGVHYIVSIPATLSVRVSSSPRTLPQRTGHFGAVTREDRPLLKFPRPFLTTVSEVVVPWHFPLTVPQEASHNNHRTFVTQSDKKGLIAGKYMCSLNNMYLKFSIR